jgi:glycerol-3-phosphate acyltransferase PlsY
MAVWLVVFLASRYVSMASLVAAVTIPISQLAFRQSLNAVLLGSCLALLIIVRHRTNIQRLLNGAERRAGSRPAVG